MVKKTDQHALFTDTIKIAIAGAIEHGLQAGELVDSMVLVRVLSEEIATIISMNPSRDQRGVIIANIWRHLRKGAKL